MKGHMLREGFTTGSAATAAAVAAFTALYLRKTPSFITVKAPAGMLNIPVRYALFSDNAAVACVVKDGGDDPDCTHGIEIVANVLKNKGQGSRAKGHGSSRLTVNCSRELSLSDKFTCFIGEGIGTVTMKGLGITVGEPAVNPVPRKMLRENLETFIRTHAISGKPSVTISVPDGAKIAKHTLNARLGIIGGISILGTTGIVKPVSMEAFTATIDISLNIARENKLDTVVLCFGRQSEDGARKQLQLPDEAYIMMGDFFRYALDRAKKMRFNVVVSGQPGKILKACLESRNTNVKYGVFSPDQTSELLRKLGVAEADVKKLASAKTARHMWEMTDKLGMGHVWEKVAKSLAKKFGIQVLLFSYEGELLAKK